MSHIPVHTKGIHIEVARIEGLRDARKENICIDYQSRMSTAHNRFVLHTSDRNQKISDEVFLFLDNPVVNRSVHVCLKLSI